MASPQTENGYSRLANEILEALIENPPTTVLARRIWDWTWRNSWGRRGALCTQPTSVRRLADELNSTRSPVARQMETLLRQQRIIRLPSGALAIEKDHEKWSKKDAIERPQSKNLKREQVSHLSGQPVPPVGTDEGVKVSHLSGQPVPPVGTACPTCRDESVPPVGTVYKEKERKKERRKNVERGKSVFVTPSVDDVRAYCLERNNKVDPEYWVDYWITRGWTMKGGQRMRDWKAAVRTWERNNFNIPAGKKEPAGEMTNIHDVLEAQDHL